MSAQLVNAAHEVDKSFLFIFGASALLLALLTAAMLWFVFRYNRKRHPVADQTEGNLWAEIVWTVLPTILVMGMFVSGWSSYKALRQVPAGALEVKVTARMWTWDFEYAGGRKSKILYAPVGRPVKLLLSSEDVLHGFYAPAFRIKIDTVPGMTTYAWFTAEKEGDYVVFCSVYCGLQHAKMLTSIRAVSPAAFDAWLAEGAVKPEEAPGRALLENKGCLGCHSLDGSPAVGPSFKDLWGRKVILVAPNGSKSTVTTDEGYLRRAILGPKDRTVEGFDPIMPSFGGQISEDEMTLILDFLRTGGKPPKDGRAVAKAEGCLSCHAEDRSVLVGPGFQGLWGSKVTAEGPGGEHDVLVDRQVVLEALSLPGKLQLKGFDPIMPAYPDLSDEDREALLGWLESLGTDGHNVHSGPGGHTP
jgi:cytochrome c oxidase subunit 2